MYFILVPYFTLFSHKGRCTQWVQIYGLLRLTDANEH